jgi:hypothetical protein
MNSIIWLHDQSLRLSHPVFDLATNDVKPLFIWDNKYFQESDYSLKRLVFIYETLCELNIDIIFGNTLDVLLDLAPQKLYIPFAFNPFIDNIISKLPTESKIYIVPDEPFVIIPDNFKFARFFQYWNKAKKSAFILNGQEKL